MAELITPAEANAWAEKTKLVVTTLDDDLLFQVQSIILGRLSSVYDVSGWTDSTSTPKLVRTIISMKYFAKVYARAYSEDNDSADNYAMRLDAEAESLLVNIIAGLIPIDDGGGDDTIGQPVFYPTDASSALCPTSDDPSLGPAHFSMGTSF